MLFNNMRLVKISNEANVDRKEDQDRALHYKTLSLVLFQILPNK